MSLAYIRMSDEGGFHRTRGRKKKIDTPTFLVMRQGRAQKKDALFVPVVCLPVYDERRMSDEPFSFHRSSNEVTSSAFGS